MSPLIAAILQSVDVPVDTVLATLGGPRFAVTFSRTKVPTSSSFELRVRGVSSSRDIRVVVPDLQVCGTNSMACAIDAQMVY